MGNFNRDNRGGGGRSFGGGRGRDYNDRGFGGGRGDREMFKTTCSNCGRECEVPFKPTGAKPVYCNDCFKTMGGADRRSDDRAPRRSFENRDNGGSRPQSNEKFDELNAKLDRILKILGSETSKTAKAPRHAEIKIEEVAEMPIVPEEEKMVDPIEFKSEEQIIVPEKKSREAGSSSAGKKSPKKVEEATIE